MLSLFYISPRLNLLWIPKATLPACIPVSLFWRTLCIFCVCSAWNWIRFTCPLYSSSPQGSGLHYGVSEETRLLWNTSGKGFPIKVYLIFYQYTKSDLELPKAKQDSRLVSRNTLIEPFLLSVVLLCLNLCKRIPPFTFPTHTQHNRSAHTFRMTFYMSFHNFYVLLQRPSLLFFQFRNHHDIISHSSRASSCAFTSNVWTLETVFSTLFGFFFERLPKACEMNNSLRRFLWYFMFFIWSLVTGCLRMWCQIYLDWETFLMRCGKLE